MSTFQYYNNDNTVRGNPTDDSHYYNYLRGIWKDNVPMTYGGDGHGSGQGSTTDQCNFMFPGTSDDAFSGLEWTEQTAGNIPADRRFLQSAGPFTLQPGAVNEITTGVVWARAKSGGQTASIALVKIYDREAQALFDNNFNILNGPDAPDLEVRELNKELIFTLSNGSTSNNLNENYREKDPYITKPSNLLTDSAYTFQGYLVYQLKNNTVSVTDLDDPDLARLVFRSDVNDTVTGIVNQYLDPLLGVYTPIEEVSSVLSDGVKGSIDQGTEYSFQITEDKFALGNTRLVNHKTYYFMSLSYGYNRAEENADPYNVNASDYDGRNQPYIGGRRNLKVYSAIPHFTEPDEGGTILNASYGDGVSITRIEGTGNGGNDLELTQESIDEILNSDDHRVYNPTYIAGHGPVNITVVDPVKIPEGDYTFKLFDPEFNGSSISSYNSWELTNQQDGSVLGSSNQSITIGSEQYIPSLGLNVKVKQSLNPGSDPANIDNNGLISSSIEYENINDRWLSGVPDRDDESGFLSFWGLNWIRSGNYTDDNNSQFSDYNQTDDPSSIFESVIEQTITTTFSGLPFGIGEITFETTGGTWAPYNFASYFQDGPGLNSNITNQVKMDNVNSVDLIFTNDQTKWSRVVIVEAQENPDLAIGGALKMGLRESASVDKTGADDGSETNGMGWFPGYAIDVETGERLNIVFAEDSWLTSDNGNDMKWNPTSNIVTQQFPSYDNTTQTTSGGNYLLGGKHFVYVINGKSWVKGTEDYINGDYTDVDNSPNYDEGEWIYNQLKDDISGVGKWKVFKNSSWVGVPLLAPGRSLLTNDARVKLRVTKPYKQYETVNSLNILTKNDALVIGENYVVAYENSATTWGGKTITHDGNTYAPGDVFQATATSFTGSSKARVVLYNPENSFNPIYQFNTNDIVASKGNNDVAKDAMELINVVPNPYYGYSEYENNQLDNRIKITNLPQIATISIFTVNGTLVRKLKKDDAVTSIDWDLKNSFGIPIASGLYIIHVATEINGEKKEKVIKWFGTLRPIDLDTF